MEECRKCVEGCAPAYAQPYEKCDTVRWLKLGGSVVSVQQTRIARACDSSGTQGIPIRARDCEKQCAGEEENRVSGSCARIT